MFFKNLSSGIIIAAGFIGLVFLFRMVLWLAWILIWPLLILGAIYFIGYYAPTDIHDAFEKKVIALFDWLDFHAPSWTWPFISFMRGTFNWLGIRIKKA